MSTPADSSAAVISQGITQWAVVDGVRDPTLSDRLLSDVRLHRDELAGSFGVTTMPVREGLGQLQAGGFVVFGVSLSQGRHVLTMSIGVCS